MDFNLNELVNEFCTRVLYFGWLNRRGRLMALIRGENYLFPVQLDLNQTIPAHYAPVVPDDLCDANLVMEDVIAEAGIPPQHHEEAWTKIYREAARLNWLPLAGRRGRQWLRVSAVRIGADVVNEAYFTPGRGFEESDLQAIMDNTQLGYQILMREPDATIFIHLGEAPV